MLGDKMGGRGGARPGAGRKKTGKLAHTITISICGNTEEIEAIRIGARLERKTISRYVMDILKKNREQSELD